MDTKTTLNQTEAGRVKTLLEKHNVKVVYRRLIGFSPEQVAADLKLKDVSAKDIAEMAGRKMRGV